MSVCDTGGVVQLRRKQAAVRSSANAKLQPAVQVVRRQETQQHDLQSSCYSDDLSDQYSDAGCPTLPRPKTILSLSRANLPWSIRQRSKSLCSVPVRVKKGRSGAEFSERLLLSICVDAAVAPVKVNKDLKHAGLAKEGSWSSGVSDSTRPFAEQESAAQTQRTVDNSIRKPVNHSVVAVAAEMSKVKSSKGQVSAAACREESGQQKAKKSRNLKPSKSLTFSFGSNSDLKRRALGFLGKKKPDRPSPATPSSPILVSRKMKSLPASARTTGLAIVESNGSSLHHGSCQDIDRTKSPSRDGGKHRPPPLTNLSSSVGGQGQFYLRAGEASPQTNYSPSFTPTSARSSQRDSSESLAKSDEASLTASRSPGARRNSGRNSGGIIREMTDQPSSSTRKLSDPVISAINSVDRSSPHSHAARAIKKRNTFCVRPSKINVNQEQGWAEMRQHVVQFLVETEQSYVESLKFILKVYYEPLKRPQASALVEPALVKDIFYQIPEICSLHERFLLQLTERVEHWDAERKIGDILVNTFSKCQLMDIYKEFIGNFMRARASIELAKQAKSVFSKFLEQRTRNNEGKLTLDDLLIKPVQRIPRYVLFIKDLLKHTAPTHPDHAPLQQALGELTLLAERVNDSERERERLGHHRELLNAVDGLADLLSPSSRFISYNMVTEVKGHVQKRDRFLILFSDILVCASSRRKSTSFKRSSLLNLNSVFPDGLRYNIKWYVPLTKTSLAQIQTPYFDRCKQNTLEKMMENLHKDEAILQEMLEKSAKLHLPHQALVAALKELQVQVKERVALKKGEFDNLSPECTRVDLISYASAPPTQYTLLFPSHKIKISWKQDFLRVKEAADCQAPPSASVAPPTSPHPVQMSVQQDLVFLNTIILQSVRAGMQLTCAAEGLPVDSTSSSCLWVCCSDGLGGQVSLLSLRPSALPQVTANITVSDSRITSIASVLPPRVTTPPSEHCSRLLPDISINSVSSSSSSDHVTPSPTSSLASDIKSVPGDRDDDLLFIEGELCLAAISTPLRSSLSAGADFARVRSNSAPPIPEPLSEDVTRSRVPCSVTSQQDKARPRVPSPGPRVPSPATGQQTLSAQSSATDSSECSRRTPTWSALTLRPSSSLEEGEGSMWLGTEAGEVHVYRVGDNLRCRNNRLTVELGAAVLCLKHWRGTVYAGLANGTLVLLDAKEPLSPRHCMAVGGGPVCACLEVWGELWVACEGSLYQLHQSTHALKAVCVLPWHQEIAAAHVTGSGVWVSMQCSPLLHLIHAPSGVLLTTTDCRHAILQALKSCDPVLRQQRSASLHVTSLHASPSQLLVGTSAGVVLTIPTPATDPSLEPHPLLHPPIATPLSHGHVDSVHFSLVIEKDGEPLVITGGNGYLNFTQNVSHDTVSNSANSLIALWR